MNFIEAVKAAAVEHKKIRRRQWFASVFIYYDVDGENDRLKHSAGGFYTLFVNDILTEDWEIYNPEPPKTEKVEWSLKEAEAQHKKELDIQEQTIIKYQTTVNNQEKEISRLKILLSELAVGLNDLSTDISRNFGV